LRVRHPLTRRLLWNPLVVAGPFAYLAYTAYLGGFPVGRTAGAAFVGLWFGLAVFDMASGHRWLDWLYSKESEPPGGEGADAESGAAADRGRT
jgi:hypothetical protein